LIARDEEQYLQNVLALAGDLPRLAGIRAALRERVRQSPLMDGPRYTRHVETAYRAMWREWCQRG
jgi:protein O-GlcNAc transferase